VFIYIYLLLHTQCGANAVRTHVLCVLIYCSSSVLITVPVSFNAVALVLSDHTL
jgi:hypothetical protein